MMSKLYLVADQGEIGRRRPRMARGQLVEAWPDLFVRGEFWMGERSKALLDEAGWKAGADGIRAKGDQKLEISFPIISRPRDNTTARSMTFSSSRTLPGQSYETSRSSASGVRINAGFRLSSPYFSRKC